MDENILQRLKRNVLNPNADNAYKAGMIAFGGKPLEQDTSALDNLIKYNQLQTGSPEFKMKEAQIRADIDLQKGLDLERAKKAQAQADYEAALVGENQGQSVSQNAPVSNIAPSGPAMPTAMPQKGNVPQYLQIAEPSTRVWDEKLGKFITKPGGFHVEKNQDYVSPEDQKANEEKSQMIKDSASQNLAAIAEAKKGSKYFGPLGNLPSIVAPSSLLGLSPEYGDRKMWENNVNQLLSRKVVDLITQMKSASKTGATGFGQLSDKEGAILREASTALTKDLPEDKALYYLNEMEKINKRILGNGNTQQVSPQQDQNSDPLGIL